MADTRLDQQSAETLATAIARAQSAQQAVEVLAREPLLRLNGQDIESLAIPLPQRRLAQQAIEVLALPKPPGQFLHQAVEVLWREQASPDIFVWPHNWATEVRERRAWRTDVMVPRRSI